MTKRPVILIASVAFAIWVAVQASGTRSVSEKPMVDSAHWYDPPPPGWVVDESTSPMDDSPTVSLTLEANQSFKTWTRRTVTPVLVIRCQERRTELYIVNGAATNTEPEHLGSATVRLRLDDAAPISQVWSESTDDKALFARSPIALVRQMARADTLTYQFTPLSSSPVIVTFTLQGLAERLPPLAKACGWRM